jgi:ribose-phosphate pyrophosphokinase
MSQLKLFAGNSHPKLAEEVSRLLGVPLSPMTIKKFASGEIYARCEESVRGADVYVIQTATSNVNEDLMELFVILDSLKRSFAGRIHVVIPHYPYARQDRVASPREPITAKLVAGLIEKAGADHVISFSLHAPQIQGFFANAMDNVNSMKLFVEYFKAKNLKDLVVVSTDAGGAKEAKKFADILGAGLAILNKSRPDHNMSEVTHVVGDVAGKNCIIFDDMIDTAGSVCGAKKALEASGATGDVYLAATHAVFSNPAIERLIEANFTEVVVTDTIPRAESEMFKGLVQLSVAPIIAQIVQNVHDQKSITNIYS